MQNKKIDAINSIFYFSSFFLREQTAQLLFTCISSLQILAQK